MTRWRVTRSVEVAELCGDPDDVAVQRGLLGERFDEVDDGLPIRGVAAPGQGGRDGEDLVRGQPPDSNANNGR